MSNTYPQRLNAMTHEQKTRRIMELEDALQQTNDRIAAAVQAERDACSESDRIVLALASIVNDLPVIQLGGGDSITGRRFAQRVSIHATAIQERNEATK